MPDENAHSVASENHLGACRDTVEAHPDWAAVMLFYSAVHLVEQLFALDGRHCCEHSEREYHIKLKYMSLWADYRALKSESLKTRYLEGGMFKMSPAQVNKKLLPRLERIRLDIQGRLKARKMPGL